MDWMRVGGNLLNNNRLGREDARENAAVHDAAGRLRLHGIGRASFVAAKMLASFVTNGTYFGGSMNSICPINWLLGPMDWLLGRDAYRE
jgi:hypothetical protein